MKKLIITIVHFFRKLRGKFWRKIFRSQCASTGRHIGISCFCRVSSAAEVHIGDFFHSNGLRVSGSGKLLVGNHFHSGENCMIMLGSHDYDTGEAIPYGLKFASKTVTIGDFVWMGTNSSIVGNVTVGDGAIIGYGAVVVKDVPPLAIVGGNPAKILKYRDRNHFETLLKEGKFN